jgi:hypothetical protein
MVMILLIRPFLIKRKQNFYIIKTKNINIKEKLYYKTKTINKQKTNNITNNKKYNITL